MSLTPKRRPRRGGELRVRSGCHNCRKRRVKCPEQHPVCQHCLRLGLQCHYEIRLTWDGARKSNAARSTSALSKNAPHRWSPYSVTVRGWMFLNTTVDDFSPSPRVRETPRPNITRMSFSDHEYTSLQQLYTPYPAAMAPNILHLGRTELRLLEYFVHFITPRCALASNPYQDILLRHAVTDARGPLMDCIMAVAANQMQIIGHGESATSALRRRDWALSTLRQQVGLVQSEIDPVPLQGGANSSSELCLQGCPEKVSDQLIWSAVMMCFFDISFDCQQSWMVHAEFASKLLLDEAAQQSSGYVSDSHQFAAAYLSLHYTLSCSPETQLPYSQQEHTAAGAGLQASLGGGFLALQHIPDESLFQTLAGCSRELVHLIAEITELAQHPNISLLRSVTTSTEERYVTASPLLARRPVSLALPDRDRENYNSYTHLKHRRDGIERGLHQLADQSIAGKDNFTNDNGKHSSSSSGLSESVGDQMYRIGEAKRLAALMYLYSRIDGSDPYKPHMIRLTEHVIYHISGISTRTNTVLWPLFIVATLGIRPSCEDDRLVVLEKLTELQQTRQLGNVRKSRQVIEDVWKARDLRASDAVKGWDILYGRLDTISLA